MSEWETELEVQRLYGLLIEGFAGHDGSRDVALCLLVEARPSERALDMLGDEVFDDQRRATDYGVDRDAWFDVINRSRAVLARLERRSK